MKTLIKYLAVFCATFGIAGAAGYTGISLFTRSAPEVILPDLTGKNIIQVLETLTRLGLNPKLHTTQYHEHIPKYGVTFQDPGPGATIKKGRDVVIYISKGFKESQLPDLRHLSLRQGLLTLEESELRPGRIVYVHAANTLKDNIIAQYPLPLARVAANSSCDLLVSKGPEPVRLVMPDLAGISLDQASDRLEALSLSTEEIRSEFDTRRPRGTVLRQSPEFGTLMLAGAGVRLVVNNPQTGLVMPPAQLREMTWVSFPVPPGFSNRHVRVVTDLFGRDTEFYNGFMKPGKNINLLIPGGIKTKIRIFIDHRLVDTRHIDPWNRKVPWASWTWNFYTGEDLWE